MSICEFCIMCIKIIKNWMKLVDEEFRRRLTAKDLYYMIDRVDKYISVQYIVTMFTKALVQENL